MYQAYHGGYTPPLYTGPTYTPWVYPASSLYRGGYLVTAVSVPLSRERSLGSRREGYPGWEPLSVL